MYAAPMPAARYTDADADSRERNYATWMHLASYGYLVFPAMFIAPLVMWLTKKGESPFIDDHGREALNFHISLAIYTIISFPLILALGLGLLLLVVVIPLWWLIFPGIAAHAASKGEYYRYPATIRFLR